LSGKQNSNATKFSTIAGGGYNVISGLQYSVAVSIGGGIGHNTCGGYWANDYNCFTTLPTGCYQAGRFSTIGGGLINSALGCWSTIGGGSYNKILQNNFYGTIGGGGGNTISSITVSNTISGGANNTSSGNFSFIGGGQSNTSSNSNSVVVGGSQNVASAEGSTIVGGCRNVVSGISSFVGGGNDNNISDGLSFIGGGSCNTASGYNSIIGGGLENTASGINSSILGGQYNDTCTFADSMIIGSNLCATQACTTFMNCASVDNLTIGSLVCVGANKVLENVPFKPNYGLFAQTSDSTPVTATIVESSIVGAGVGTLSVPANAFSVGDSFDANFTGILSAIGTATLQVRVKTLSGALLMDTGLISMATATGKIWTLALQFTVRQIGTTSVASISSGGLFSYIKDASSAFEGFTLSTVNTTTFDTTINNTLVVTAQWNTNNAGNSIFSRNFTLNKIY
jgi:hypothetical protein